MELHPTWSTLPTQNYTVKTVNKEDTSAVSGCVLQLTAAPLPKKISGQTTYPSQFGGKHLSGDTGQMTTNPGKDEDMRWKLVPSCSSQ